MGKTFCTDAINPAATAFLISNQMEKYAFPYHPIPTFSLFSDFVPICESLFKFFFKFFGHFDRRIKHLHVQNYPSKNGEETLISFSVASFYRKRKQFVTVINILGLSLPDLTGSWLMF